MSSLDGGLEEIRRIAAEEGGAAESARVVDDLAASRRQVTGRASSPGGEVTVTVDHLGRVQRVDYFAAIASIAAERVATLTMQATAAARQQAAAVTVDLMSAAFGPEVAVGTWQQLGVAAPVSNNGARSNGSPRGGVR